MPRSMACAMLALWLQSLVVGKAVSLHSNFTVPMHPSDRPLSALPAPLQDSKRLLVAVVVHDRKRQHLLLKQIHHYVAICEQGFEVHVVMYTTVSWFPTSLFDPAVYHCLRLSMDLPVVMVQHKTDIAKRLSGQHRVLFANYVNTYDYFMMQEDDIAIRWQHIHYLTEYFQRLNGTTFIPGLQLFEVPVRSYNTSNVMVSPPYFKLMELAFPMSLTRHKQDVLVSMTHAYSCMYMLPQHHLKALVAQEDWLGDLDKDPTYFNGMINEHFAGWFLGTKGFQVVLPVAGFHAALAHHVPNNYLYLLDPRPSPWLNRNLHKSRIEVVEVASMLATCLGLPLPGYQGYDISQARHTAHFQKPVQECFVKNMHAQLQATIPSDHHSDWRIGVDCKHTVVVQVQTTLVP